MSLGVTLEPVKARRDLADTLFQGRPIGSYAIIDLDLSKFDQLAARFAREKQDSTAFLKSVRNQHPQRGVQPSDRRHRAGRHSITITTLTDRPDRRREIATRGAHL